MDTDPYTDTEAVSLSLLFLLARSATHAEGVTLFCPLSTATFGRRPPNYEQKADFCAGCTKTTGENVFLAKRAVADHTFSVKILSDTDFRIF